MRKNEFDSCGLVDIYGKKQDFTIVELEYALDIKNTYKKAPHKHDFFQIIYITKGGGIHTVDSKTYEAKRDDIFFINSWQQHQWSFTPGVEGYIINFKHTFLTQFVADHLFVHDLPFFRRYTTEHRINTTPFNAVIHTIIYRMMEELKSEVACIDLVRTYLVELLLVCKKSIKDNDNKEYYSNELIKQFEALIESHFHEYKFPKQYATLLNVTPNYLNAVCQKAKGKSAGDLIRIRILNESKRLLLNTNLSASDIATKLSFKDNSYFSRFFKKEIGISPDEFRKK